MPLADCDSRPRVRGNWGTGALSVAATMHDMADVPFVGEGDDREPMFQAAQRHSRMVRFYRGAIPVSLIVILATIAAVAYFQPQRLLAKLPIDPGRVFLSDKGINMEAPRLGGFTRDRRPYALTAPGAAQGLRNPRAPDLQEGKERIN